MKKLLAVLALVAATLIAAPVQNAQASVSCGNRTQHWWMKDGPIWFHVAWVELHIEVCTNGDEITSSSASKADGETSTGSLNGYQVDLNTPYRTGFDSGGFSGGTTRYRADGSLRSCLPGTSWFCSGHEDFKIFGEIDMLNKLVITATEPNQFVVGRRVFQVRWGWACTNDLCTNNLHMGTS